MEARGCHVERETAGNSVADPWTSSISLSQPCCLGVLWRFHDIGMVGEIIDHWWLALSQALSLLWKSEVRLRNQMYNSYYNVSWSLKKTDLRTSGGTQGVISGPIMSGFWELEMVNRRNAGIRIPTFAFNHGFSLHWFWGPLVSQPLHLQRGSPLRRQRCGGAWVEGSCIVLSGTIFMKLVIFSWDTALGQP